MLLPRGCSGDAPGMEVPLPPGVPALRLPPGLCAQKGLRAARRLLPLPTRVHLKTRSVAGAGFYSIAMVSQAPPPAAPELWKWEPAGSRLPELTLRPRRGFNPSGLSQGGVRGAAASAVRMRRTAPTSHGPQHAVGTRQRGQHPHPSPAWARCDGEQCGHGGSQRTPHGGVGGRIPQPCVAARAWGRDGDRAASPPGWGWGHRLLLRIGAWQREPLRAPSPPRSKTKSILLLLLLLLLMGQRGSINP